MLGLCLVLALDLSGSIRPDDRTLILGGTAGALTHPAVIEAFSGQDAAVSVITFAERASTIVPWTNVANSDDLYNVAMATSTAVPMVGQSTNIPLAIRTAREALEQVECEREIVDILTDAEGGHYGSPKAEVEQFDEAQTINVLLVGNRASFDVRTDLRWGYAGFVLPIGSLSEVEEATVRKLVLEVS